MSSRRRRSNQHAVDPVIAYALVGTCLFPLVAIAAGLFVVAPPFAPMIGLLGGGVGLIVGLFITFLTWYVRGGPLHHAARSGQHEWLADLAANDWSTGLRNGCGETPLDLAISHGEIGCIMALINAGARFDPRSHDMAKRIFTEKGYLEILKCLEARRLSEESG